MERVLEIGANADDSKKRKDYWLLTSDLFLLIHRVALLMTVFSFCGHFCSAFLGIRSEPRCGCEALYMTCSQFWEDLFGMARFSKCVQTYNNDHTKTSQCINVAHVHDWLSMPLHQWDLKLVLFLSHHCEQGKRGPNGHWQWNKTSWLILVGLTMNFVIFNTCLYQLRKADLRIKS